MKRRSLNLALALLAGSAGWRTALGQQAGWTALFNGRDFTGWDKLGDANWRVEEGMLVADRGNGFLVTQAPMAISSCGSSSGRIRPRTAASSSAPPIPPIPPPPTATR